MDKELKWEGHWWGVAIEPLSWKGRNLLEKIVEDIEPNSTNKYEEGRLVVTRNDNNKISKVEFLR